MPHALLVDDDGDSAETMAMLIANEGFTVATAGSLREARRQMALQEPDLVLLDLMLPDGNGMELFNDAKSLPNTEIVLITGHASLDTSIQALRLGAADYLVKPTSLKQLQGVLSRVTKPSALKAAAGDLEEGLEKEGHFGALWGRSPEMRKVYQQIVRVAGTAVTVFITGESGTGKEVVARTVHELSRRKAKPFLAVNCGAISPHLIESEIFGHEKGSFTGADRQHLGFFERTSGGTLFLDEITEMPLDLQVKLLRVLETGTFMRVGSTQVQEADVRMIAATNRNPLQAVASGKLREDLMYRLNVFPIHLPPLRDRAEDVPLIATHFLDQISEREGQKKRFAPEALARLAEYKWQGNVRELRNVVYRAYVMATGSTIVDECLPASEPARGGSNGQSTITIKLGSTLADVERQVTLATLEHLGRHKEKTAATLGISLKTLYNRLKEYAADGDAVAASVSGALDESR
ncbi:sigma-54-dependent transcriptional regulator [Piscinibacter koreensis]|uniref:Sigma-54-dependent Fis family transcriptional regulator n=1 Tax=Piscinibacter koreensis TaxID=2742824 RepID=A0A7Y6NKN8_9BURK|nr:sigma-54 dependent transcriptional regulator [Schlegelella koreensis]NUZ04978.1 sigma-54-dependent Fis family transcriptional regulator [Schlegelella koreensis]